MQTTSPVVLENGANGPGIKSGRSGPKEKEQERTISVCTSGRWALLQLRTPKPDRGHYLLKVSLLRPGIELSSV